MPKKGSKIHIQESVVGKEVEEWLEHKYALELINRSNINKWLWAALIALVASGGFSIRSWVVAGAAEHKIESVERELESVNEQAQAIRERERQQAELDRYYGRIERDIRKGFALWIDGNLDRIMHQSITEVLSKDEIEAVRREKAADSYRVVAAGIRAKIDWLAEHLKSEFNGVLRAEIAMTGNLPPFARNVFREWLDPDTGKSKLVEDTIADALATRTLVDAAISFIRKDRNSNWEDAQRDEFIDLLKAKLQYSLNRGRYEVESIWREQNASE